MYPIALLNEHHIRPRAFGGDDSPSNKKYLCPNCHQTLHRLADLMLTGKSGAARAYAAIFFSDPSQAKEILRYAAEAAKWEKKHQTETPDYAKAEVHKKIVLNLPADMYRRLLTLATETGMRKKSVPALVLKLISGILSSRYSKRGEETDDGSFESVKRGT